MNKSLNSQKSKESIVATCRALADRGFLAGTGGNIAMRVDAQHFAITPSATDYYQMAVDDICVLRNSDLIQVEGSKSPSVEKGLHAQVFRRRPDCVASIHTHQPLASAFTLLGIALPISDAKTQALIGRRIPIVSYAPSGTAWLSSLVGRAMTPHTNAYLMRNHGVVCCGSDMNSAVQSVLLLEEAAQQFLHQAISRSKDLAPEVRQQILTLLNE